MSQIPDASAKSIGNRLVALLAASQIPNQNLTSRYFVGAEQMDFSRSRPVCVGHDPLESGFAEHEFDASVAGTQRASHSHGGGALRFRKRVDDRIQASRQFRNPLLFAQEFCDHGVAEAETDRGCRRAAECFE